MVYRRYRRSRARTYRRYRRSSFNRARRSNQFAAMQQQRDLAKFCLKYRRDLVVRVNGGSSSDKTGTATVDAMDILGQVPQYTYLAGLFDECRIAGIRLKLIPTFQVSTNDTSRMTQVTAWDRNGIHNSINPTFEEICTYGSSYKQSATAFSKNSVTTSIYATDLSERTIYVPTAQIGKLTSIEQPYARAFDPLFMVGIQLPAVPPTTQDFYYELEIAFDLVFRGTRYDNKSGN